MDFIVVLFVGLLFLMFHNWLLDIELFREELRTDLVSIWMEGRGINILLT
jgi:hypothetical protein